MTTSEPGARGALPADRSRALSSPLGIYLPTIDPLRVGLPDPAEAARAAEALGFGSIWVGDHLAFRVPLLDSTVALAAAAGATSRVRLGYGVYLLALRQVALAAKQLASLQLISDDRLVLGIGVGGEEPAEYWLAGIDPAQRGARTDDSLNRLVDLISGAPTSVPELRQEVSLQPAATVPPIWVGGRVDAALDRAVRFGEAWMAAFCTPSSVRRSLDALQERADAAGRSRPSAAVTLFVHVSSDRSRAESEVTAAAQAQYGLDYATLERFAAIGDVDDVTERIGELADAGIEEFTLLPLASNWYEQADRLAHVQRQMGAAHVDRRAR